MNACTSMIRLIRISPKRITFCRIFMLLAIVRLLSTTIYRALRRSPSKRENIWQNVCVLIVLIDQLAHCFLGFNREIDLKTPPEPFEYRHRGSMAYIGENKAVVDFDNSKTKKGTIGWLIWRGAYMTMAESIRNKIKIPTYWALTWFLGRETSRFWNMISNSLCNQIVMKSKVMNKVKWVYSQGTIRESWRSASRIQSESFLFSNARKLETKNDDFETGDFDWFIRSVFLSEKTYSMTAKKAVIQVESLSDDKSPLKSMLGMHDDRFENTRNWKLMLG